MEPKWQAEHFRAKAIECLERSSRITDPEYLRLYYDLAAQWLVLAHEADMGCASSSPRIKESPATGGAKSRSLIRNAHLLDKPSGGNEA
jgi:hypothetical protein